MKSKLNAVLFIVAVAATITFAINVTATDKKSDAKSKIAAAHNSLNAAKKSLGEDYDCCMHPDCDFCALASGKCQCGANIKAGKAICGNCADGWEAGHGDVKGIDKSKIKRYSAAEAKAMFDRKK